MENRHLCRGKRIDGKGRDGQWVIGYYCYLGYVGIKRHYIIPKFASDFYGFEVDPDTVGRCVGIGDKNDNLIFEDDILKFDDVGEDGYEFTEGCDFVNVATVCWKKGRFELTDFWDDNSGVLDEMDAADHRAFVFVFSVSEVIGNIHDKK